MVYRSVARDLVSRHGDSESSSGRRYSTGMRQNGYGMCVVMKRVEYRLGVRKLMKR